MAEDDIAPKQPGRHTYKVVIIGTDGRMLKKRSRLIPKEAVRRAVTKYMEFYHLDRLDGETIAVFEVIDQDTEATIIDTEVVSSIEQIRSEYGKEAAVA